MNLITKLTEKLKAFGYKISESTKALLDHIHINGNCKIVKKILDLILCGVMTFSIGTMTACNTDNPNVGPGTTTEQPGDNEDLKQYSQILQTVLTDSYYTKLTDEYKLMIGEITVDSTKIEAHPYGYLKQEGYDINAFLDYSARCNTSIYSKANNPKELIISTMVNDSYNGNPYYTCYTLTYSLTDKELNDLNMLHKDRYIQAPLFIQELTYQKQPITTSKAKITKTAYDALVSNVNSSKKINEAIGKSVLVDLLDFDITESNLFVQIRNVYSSNRYNMIYPDQELMIATNHVNRNNIEIIGDNIYISPTTGITCVDIDNVIANREKITYYNSTGASVYVNDELSTTK